MGIGPLFDFFFIEPRNLKFGRRMKTRKIETFCSCEVFDFRPRNRPTAENHRPTAENHRPTAENHRPTAENHRPTAENHRPTAEIHRPTAEIHRPTGKCGKLYCERKDPLT